MVAAWVCSQSLLLCLTLCDALDCILPGSSLPGILQARILEWVARPPPGDLPDPRIKLASYASCIGRWVLYHYGHLGSPHGL